MLPGPGMGGRVCMKGNLVFGFSSSVDRGDILYIYFWKKKSQSAIISKQHANKHLGEKNVSLVILGDKTF